MNNFLNKNKIPYFQGGKPMRMRVNADVSRRITATTGSVSNPETPHTPTKPPKINIITPQNDSPENVTRRNPDGSTSSSSRKGSKSRKGSSGGKGSKGNKTKDGRAKQDLSTHNSSDQTSTIETPDTVTRVAEEPVITQEQASTVERNLGVNQPMALSEIEVTGESNPFALRPKVRKIVIDGTPAFVIDSKVDVGDGVYEMLPSTIFFNHPKRGLVDAVTGRWLNTDDLSYDITDQINFLINSLSRREKWGSKKSLDLNDPKTRNLLTEQLGLHYHGDRALSPEQMTQLLLEGGDPKVFAARNKARAANQTAQDTPGDKNTNTAEEKTFDWKKHAKRAILPSMFFAGTILWDMFGPKQSYSPEGEDTSDTGVVDQESGTDTTTMYYAPGIVPKHNPDIIYYGGARHPLDVAKIMRDDLRVPDTLYYNRPADSIFMIRRSPKKYDFYRWNEEGKRIIDEFNF